METTDKASELQIVEVLSLSWAPVAPAWLVLYQPEMSDHYRGSRT